jgi:Zn-dependent protease
MWVGGAKGRIPRSFPPTTLDAKGNTAPFVKSAQFEKHADGGPLIRSLKIGRVAGAELFVHGSVWLLPAFVLARGLRLYSVDEALLQTSLVFGVYACLFLHELTHLLVATCVNLGVRDITFYPFGGAIRLCELNERPRKEIWMAAIGPLLFALIAGGIAAVLLANGDSLAPRFDDSYPYGETFFNRLFWLNVFLGVLHLLPVFPLDGGRVFRGALALTAGRLRATEIAALLCSFIALLFLAAGMIWFSVGWWLMAIGIVIHVCGQQELMRVRYFATLNVPAPASPTATPILVSTDQLIDEDSRPGEPDFSGCTWNATKRLWIVWKNGEAVSANAVVGE